jgi:hypothetical protein
MPSLHALLICDMVIREAMTNKHSAVGIFTDVHSSKFPMVLNPLAVYASIGDAIGAYEVSMVIHNLETGEVAGRVRGLKLVSKDKLSHHDFGIRMVNSVFPKPAKYEFQLLVDDRLLGSKTLRVHQRDMPIQRPPWEKP